MKLRKYYVYVISLMILTLFFGIGYYLYMEYRPVTYKNSTFVQLPKELTDDMREFLA